jgi:hypothetical protein
VTKSCRLHEKRLAAEADLILFLQLQPGAPRFFFQQPWKNKQRERGCPRQCGSVIGGAAQWSVQFWLNSVIEQPAEQAAFQQFKPFFLRGSKWLRELRCQIEARFRRESRRHFFFSTFHFIFSF